MVHGHCNQRHKGYSGQPYWRKDVDFQDQWLLVDFKGWGFHYPALLILFTRVIHGPCRATPKT